MDLLSVVQRKKSHEHLQNIARESKFRRMQAKGRGGQTGAQRKPQFEHLTKHSKIGQTLASRCNTRSRPGQHKLNIKIAETQGEYFPTQSPIWISNSSAHRRQSASCNNYLIENSPWVLTDREAGIPHHRLRHRVAMQAPPNPRGLQFWEGGSLWNLWR